MATQMSKKKASGVKSSKILMSKHSIQLSRGLK